MIDAFPLPAQGQVGNLPHSRGDPDPDALLKAGKGEADLGGRAQENLRGRAPAWTVLWQGRGHHLGALDRRHPPHRGDRRGFGDVALFRLFSVFDRAERNSVIRLNLGDRLVG